MIPGALSSVAMYVGPPTTGRSEIRWASSLTLSTPFCSVRTVVPGAIIGVISGRALELS
jgi:hypothetical protein